MVDYFAFSSHFRRPLLTRASRSMRGVRLVVQAQSRAVLRLEAEFADASPPAITLPSQ